MKFRLTVMGLAAAALAALSGPAAAQGTTQALALVESHGPVQLVCHGRDCWAEFSSFCLQEDRRSQNPDTRFELASKQDIQLIGERADGSQVILAPEKELQFSAYRTHVAVRVGLARSRLNELDLEKVTLTIGQKVALLPMPTAAEPAIGAAEVAYITSSLRPTGKRIVDSDNKRMATARLINRMINALPPGGRVARAVRDGLWAATMTPAKLASVSTASRELMTSIYQHCLHGANYAQHSSMRGCLESKHDTLLGDLNMDYWAAVKKGS